MRRSLAFASLAFVLACCGLSADSTTRAARGDEAAGQVPVQFNRDIRPILSENCYKCHGPDAKQRQAGLRFDVAEAATTALESGHVAVVPGKSGASELIARLTHTDPALRMPPADSGKQVTPEQIEMLKRWIDQGAQWQGHWSFIPPQRPELPPVKDAARAAQAIDRFVLARLEAAGLTLSSPADKVTLIRRATLDLTGLPPTPEEVQNFVNDNSQEAFEHVVDRLLKSPRFGEHMARYWLDLARYGDTHGLHFDNERALWKYREWVIGAFNENKPFSQFVIEQLAGDLLPSATLDQQIATGFNRCNVTTSEGGSIDQEVFVRYAVDRTETMSTVFMGLTLGCAVCHDHKFDPISQKEFYQLYAFFNAAADAAMDGNQLAPPPIIKTPSAEHMAKLKEFDDRVAAARAKIAEALAKVEYVEPEPKPDAPKPNEPQEYVWIEDDAPAGAQLQGDTPWEWVEQPVFSGKRATRRKAAGLSQHFYTGASPGLKIGEGDKLFAYVHIDPADPAKTVMLQFNDGSWEHRAYWGEDLIPFGAGDNENHRRLGDLPKTGEWVRLEVDAAAVGLKPGAVLNGWAFTQHAGTVHWDKAGILTRTPQDGKSFESLAAWEVYEATLQQSSVPQGVRDAIKLTDARTAEQQKLIRDYFLEHVYAGTRPTFQPLHEEIAAVERDKKALEDSIPVSMIMADLPQPRESHVLVRGQYDKLGEKVGPSVPEVFPPMPENAPANRLGLAQWLTQPAHPLTARVAVNRFWQQLFGRGIVKTSEDFGAQGEWPSHPELLDWLAVEFMERGWDVKGLLKQIVMSETYRQASDVSPALLKADPENVLLSRGPRFRLDAEVVRDSALAIAGLLTEKLGGPSARPYQPDGIWQAVAFVGSNTGEFKRDSGDGLYRRSLYTFWKRTAPPPSLMAFDAPSRESCVARRGRTNTPLQALVLMNDEQYVEAARELAERMLTQGGGTPTEQLRHGFSLATGRQPSERELAVLSRVHADQLAHFQAQIEEAKKLLAVGEAKRDEAFDPAAHAAMTMAANVILNLDEVVTKE